MKITQFAKPLYVMLKPVGAACNLRCQYCYYLDKKGLYPDEKTFIMSENMLQMFTKQYLESQTTSVLFAWHGGEPLLHDIKFYKKALDWQRYYGVNLQIGNSLQTNGTLLNDDWCKFFKDNNFLIGISVDGPEHCHDIYRKTADKKTTFSQVMRGIELLKKHDVDFNIMGVVNDYNADYSLDFYNFFKEIDARFIQFSPIVEKLPDGSLAPWNVPSEKWGDFLIAIFDEWARNDIGKFYIQHFDSTLANWVGEPTGTCIFAKTCGHAGIMEFNGDVYSCDHFVFPEHKLGNIRNKPLKQMMYSQEQIKFGADKFDTLPEQCRHCKYLFACNGECPKNRIINAPNGESGLNYLCKGYYKYFEHVSPYMDFMKRELDNKRPPSNIMQAIRNNNI